MDPDGAHLDLGHAPRVGAEQEDVPRGRLDREVLVHRADRHAVRVEHDAVVARLRDGAPAGERRQPGAPPGAQATVHGVVVQVRAPAPPARLDPPAGQRHHVVEVLARQLGVGGGLPAHGPHRLDVALLGGGHLGHQLLGQHVQRGDRGLEQVEAALAHGGEQGGALDQLVPRRRVEAPGGRPVPVVVGPAHALEEGPDGAGRADLADELDRSDVDPELERRGGHQRAQVAGAQARLDDAPSRRGEAAVVCRHEERRVDVAVARGLLVGEPLGQLVGHPLRHLASVDEDEGGAVVAGVLRNAVQDVGHLAAAQHRLELGGGQLDRHLEVAGVPAVDDDRGRTALVHPREQPRHEVEGALRRREPDALQAASALVHERVEPLETQRQVAAPLVTGERVHLVDDHGADAAQQCARGRCGEEEVERLGSSHEQVG